MSDAIGWRVLRVVSVMVAGVIGARLMATIWGRHCTQSLDLALNLGAPMGFGIAAGALSHARHRSVPRTTTTAVIVLAASCVACSIANSYLFGTIDRGKQKYTLADMREIAKAIESGREVEGRTDGWGTAYLIRRSGSSYSIVSFGDCSVPDIPLGTQYGTGPTSSFKDDIVFADGHFIRYPRGTAP